ncbi:MAG: phosphoadenylyl-sulfate reductase [Myxococcota bacterium]|nr:phosphoadenylyl-sulfate reductase [Myxococcota bacterium]
MNVQFEQATSTEILTWAFETYGERIALSTAFGPSGVVLMHLASQVKPGARVFFIDTGFHFQETLDMLPRIQDRLPIELEVIRPELTVSEQDSVYGKELFVINPDKCCAMRKVEPTQAMVNGLDAWVTALRRDQGPSRAHLQPFELRHTRDGALAKINPLVKWTRADVWRHIFAHDLPYNPLHDQGYASIGCAPCTQPTTDPTDERSGRWSGQGKTECGLHTMI